VVLREQRKGVKVMSIEDGTVISRKTKIHNNPILQILMTNDNKQIITCSKDKKVKVFDWVRQEITNVLLGHGANI